MRIEAYLRAGGVKERSGTSRAANGGTFQPSGPEAGAHASHVAPAAPSAGIDALLALQSIGTATDGRKRAVRRGLDLLDDLDDLRADLLSGRLDPARLDRLAGTLAQARETASPQIDALLDDIELRVQVELAKQGRYLVS